jgi:hypothetical protein
MRSPSLARSDMFVTRTAPASDKRGNQLLHIDRSSKVNNERIYQSWDDLGRTVKAGAYPSLS